MSHINYMYTCMNMLTCSSEWILNPMRYIGNILKWGNHEIRSCKELFQDNPLLGNPSMTLVYESFKQTGKYISLYIPTYIMNDI